MTDPHEVTPELPGTLEHTIAVAKQQWPCTVDAREWVDEWLKVYDSDPAIAADRGTMLGWFANAIMAGYDTAMLRRAQREPNTVQPASSTTVMAGSPNKVEMMERDVVQGIAGPYGYHEIHVPSSWQGRRVTVTYNAGSGQ